MTGKRYVSSTPVCPVCGTGFDTPLIAGGYVRCPACHTPMFQYRYDGDDELTPREFMGLLHPRANRAITDCRRWFGGPGVLRSGMAAAYVLRLWPTLAAIFQKEPIAE